jgi:glycosyltransferase involved in cell wall biosynthesis
MARSMALMPALAAESPIAAARIERFLRRFGCTATKVHTLPHPVADDYMQVDGTEERHNRIVSVGRWDAYQKNFPLLLRTLEGFLGSRPDWSADVIGNLPKGWSASGLGPGLRERIRCYGRLPHREISAHYQRSKIFLMSSRYESYNIAAAEALCCGCSVVGPGDIASVPFFVSKSSGTTACRPSPTHLLDALRAEVEAWNTGQRDPARISSEWRATVGAQAIGKRAFELLESIAAY